MAPENLDTNRQGTEVDRALCRATLYGALAVGFRSTTKETVTRLILRENAATLTQAATHLDPDGGSELASAARALATAENFSPDGLLEAFGRIFGHTARGGTSPYETEYGTEALFQQPHGMGDLMGFYRAFGLTLNARERERPDHISCECEFASFLALKEAYALDHKDDAMLEETRKATRLFLRDHLGRFAPAFAKRLKLAAGTGFYDALSDLCYRLVTLDCGRLGVPVGSQSLSLRPATDDRVPMACGSGAECMAMPGAGGPEESE